jgi:hypothetical protein
VKRFARILFNSSAMMSGAVIVAGVILASISPHEASIQRIGVHARLDADKFVAHNWEYPRGEVLLRIRFWPSQGWQDHGVHGEFGGIRIDYFPDSPMGRWWTVYVSTWWLIPALLPGFAFVCFHLRMRNAPTGICSNCGYDLRATPERCPECGKPAC